MEGGYITPEEMARIESEAVTRGISVEDMMEKAGMEVALFLRRKLGDLKGKMVVVFCGTGNNGGDGLVAARYLRSMGADVKVVLLGKEDEIKTEEARKNWKRFEGEKIQAKEPGELQRIKNPDAVVDAIFGTGIKGRVREPARTAIKLINGLECYKVSVDIPSGLDPLTGEVHDVAVRANATVALHMPKIGLKGREEFTGEVYVAPIGIS